jgi:hypothetical protein
MSPTYGHARYVIPILFALPLALSAFVDKRLQLSAVSLVTPLLLYAGCMVYAQSIRVSALARDGGSGLDGCSCPRTTAGRRRESTC